MLGSPGPLPLSPRMSPAGSRPPFVAGISAGFWPPSPLAAAELSPRFYTNRYPASELDELAEYFVLLPGAVSPAGSGAGALPRPPGDAAAAGQGPAIAFRLRLQGGVGGET